MGVYPWVEMFIIPILGVDRMHGASLNSFCFCCSNCSFSFLLAFASTTSLSFSLLCASASSACLLASSLIIAFSLSLFSAPASLTILLASASAYFL
jgi:hypothetical protein